MRAKSAKEKIGICTYCGLQKPLTRDHIPPKSFLAKPYPTLLTVPSCIECNQSFQADDEYTRMMAVTDLRNWNFDAQSKLSAILRSLQRPSAAGFGRYIRNQSSWMRLLDPRGKPITAIELDKARVNSTATRLLKAFHFVETGRRLLPTDKIKVGIKLNLQPNDPAMLQFARLYQACSKRPHRQFGNAFSYGAGLHNDFSVWVMILYDWFFWLATVTNTQAESGGSEQMQTVARPL